MTSSFRRDLQRQSQIQEAIREGVITNPAPKIMRRYSMDSIGTGVAIGVSVEDSPLPPTPIPSYIKPNQFDADIFCSIVSKYLATEPPPVAPISSSPPSAASALLLHQREEYHTIERAEYQRMLEMLDSRKKEIEYDEGINMADAMQGASRPGVCSISPTVLEWISHDRMLKEWKKKMTRGSKKPVGGRN
eukprot:CAMPEP_0202453424 /NCGR_PEP_ID=MMETSP1360-20130828/11402_1 /ASSEMBLY_ACC=CAM_ASM_000848 /TAXON_ID=515479 /ORGANISM="Licmophora paradoxa, Strain CCMP2313" /LENGTH=189 /DNA_ID=CAMNT_0049072507 /DNA_START=161 /DNA_END=730 /DNA_ORIENTATION=-